MEDNLLSEGRIISKKYEVLEFLGKGLEGEVYKVRERYTHKLRAIKLFYPQRDRKGVVSSRIAKKLDKLSESPLVLNYLSYEFLKLRNDNYACMTTEYIDGEMLSNFVHKQRQKRLNVFVAIHLLYTLAIGIESIHSLGEYHGDLHTDNILIQKFGLEFDLKIIDFHHWGDSKKANREEDIVKLVRIFYDILGGQKYYASQPSSVKYIICGLKRTLILDRFKTINHLIYYIENMDWSGTL